MSRSMIPLSSLSLLTALLMGCPGGSDPVPDTQDTNVVDETGSTDDTDTPDDVDLDGDGFLSSEDCDDDNADIYPGADESCTDEADMDCDGLISYVDADSDGSPECLDCDDLDAARYPEAEEILGDGVDNNCNDVVDGEAAIDDVSIKFMGEAEGDAVGLQGHGLSTAGDVDGDGLADVLIGSGNTGSTAGAAYVILGASISTDITLDAADIIIRGDSAGDYAGYEVADAGDVDGDGMGDILVGAYGADDAGSNAGKACLFLGASLTTRAEWQLSEADYCFLGEAEGDAAGMYLSGAGDVDGDGRSDFLIGASSAGETDPGKAYLILAAGLGSDSEISLGDADYQFIGQDDDQYAGGTVSDAGDVDGDGLGDILVGAYGVEAGGEDMAGEAYLFLGASLGTTSQISLSDADYAFSGEEMISQIGLSLETAGDVDGDGLDDLLLSSPNMHDGATYGGKVYVVLASSLGATSFIDLGTVDRTIYGETVYEWAGKSVAGLGDLDGDGLADILVGAPSNNDSGWAYVFMGSSLSLNTQGVSEANVTWVGQEWRAYTGMGVESAGDVNGDGIPDALVAEPSSSDNGTSSGTIHLMLDCQP